jgi:DNA-binding NarL/FixJ family response regulator
MTKQKGVKSMTAAKPLIRVMIVDDYQLMREILSLAIASFGDMEVIAQATNGWEAVEAYETHQPDVTLMDIEMPILDGLGAMRAILARFPAARIIVLTGVGDLHDYHRQSAEAGAYACLGKHGAYTQLAEKIRQVHQEAIKQEVEVE